MEEEDEETIGAKRVDLAWSDPSDQSNGPNQGEPEIIPLIKLIQ